MNNSRRGTKRRPSKRAPKVESPPEEFFRNLWYNAHPQFSQAADLMEILSHLRITNIVATFNLDVKNIALSRIAGEHAFCNYHRGTFAAMGVRILTPKCSALIYPAGVVVCMATQSLANTWLAAFKFVDVLNERVGIPCSITGLQVDNYVCSVLTFKMDMSAIRPEWTAVIDYDHAKFPGAIFRCGNIVGLPFPTNVHIAVFDSGKTNITGARSLYEALYMFVCIFFEYLVHMRASKRQRPADHQPAVWKMPVIRDAGMRPVKVESHYSYALRYMHRLEMLQRQRNSRISTVSRVEDRDGTQRYMAVFEDGTDAQLQMEADVENIDPEQVDKIIAAAAMADF